MSKNRKRLLAHEVADEFFAAVVRQARLRRYISSDHLAVDGTLLEAWASHKSFNLRTPPAVGPARWPQCRGPMAGAEALHRRPTALRRASVDGARNALFVDADLTAEAGYAERDCAVEMLARLPASTRRRTVAADNGYDARDFVAQTRHLGFTPHVAPNTTNRRSAIDGRTTGTPGTS